MQRVGLHQHTLKLYRLQQLAQGLDLATGIGGVGDLGDRQAQRLGVKAHLGNETRCTRGALSDGATQCLAVTHKGVELLCHARLGRHPVAQQGFKARHIQLGQQQTERRVRWRLAEFCAQQLIQRCRWRLANRSIPTSEPWPLRIERIATSSIHHWGKRMPRRMRQSGSALRKLIRSVAAAKFSSGEAKRFGRGLRTKPELTAARQSYWDRLLIGPGHLGANLIGCY